MKSVPEAETERKSYNHRNYPIILRNQRKKNTIVYWHIIPFLLFQQRYKQANKEQASHARWDLWEGGGVGDFFSPLFSGITVEISRDRKKVVETWHCSGFDDLLPPPIKAAREGRKEVGKVLFEYFLDIMNNEGLAICFLTSLRVYFIFSLKRIWMSISSHGNSSTSL